MPLTMFNRAGTGKFELLDLYGRGSFTTRKISYIQDSLLFDLNATIAASYPGSGITWTDLSGNGRNGTLTNGPTYSSADGGSIVFDGTDDSVNISGLDLRRNFSLEAWVKFDTLTNEGLFGQGIANNNSAIGIRQTNSTSLYYLMYFNDLTVTTPTTSTGQWYHYVVTYNHSSPYTKQVYRNGVLLGESTSGQSQYIGTGDFRLGQSYGPAQGTVEPLDGNISIARGYSKILSAEEVSINFNGFRNLYGV